MMRSSGIAPAGKSGVTAMLTASNMVVALVVVDFDAFLTGLLVLDLSEAMVGVQLGDGSRESPFLFGSVPASFGEHLIAKYVLESQRCIGRLEFKVEKLFQEFRSHRWTSPGRNR